MVEKSRAIAGRRKSLWERTVEREVGPVWLCRNWIFVGWKPTWYFAALAPRFARVIFPIIEAIVRPGSPLSFSARQIRRASSIDGTEIGSTGFNCANRGGFEGSVSLKEYAALVQWGRETNTQSICYLFVYLFAGGVRYCTFTGHVKTVVNVSVTKIIKVAYKIIKYNKIIKQTKIVYNYNY